MRSCTWNEAQSRVLSTEYSGRYEREGERVVNPFPTTRRQVLRDAFCGFGGLALTSLLHEERARANPLAPKEPHLPATRARAVIFLFMSGGPSHLETFDP